MGETKFAMGLSLLVKTWNSRQVTWTWRHQKWLQYIGRRPVEGERLKKMGPSYWQELVLAIGRLFLLHTCEFLWDTDDQFLALCT